MREVSIAVDTATTEPPTADDGWSGTAAAAPVGALTGRGAATGQATGLAVGTTDTQAAARAVAAARARLRDDDAGEAGAVGAAVRTRPPRPDPGPRSRRRRLPGDLHPGQLVAAEIALVTGVAVHRQPWPVLVPVTVVAVLLLGLCLVRWSGRWAYQWCDVWLRHRSSRRRRPLPAADRPAARADALLDAVVDGGWLGEVDLDGVPAALWAHDGGLAVALEVTVLGERPERAGSVPLPPVTGLLPAADEGGARFTVQLVEQVHVASRGAGPAALSYRELTGGEVPAVRRTWVALQVLRGPDDGTTELQTDLANATRRVVRRLRKAGLRAVPLGPDDAVVGLLGLLGPSVEADHPQVAERWSHWSAGSRRHLTAALDLTGTSTVPAVLDELRRRVLGAGTTTVVAVAARRVDDGFVDVQVTLRATLPGARPDRAADAQVARDLLGSLAGGTLRRLDGQHRSGVAATLPLGGFLR